MRDHIQNEKGANATGPILNVYQSMFTTPSSLPQVGNLQPIGNLAKKILEDMVIISSTNLEEAYDD